MKNLGALAALSIVTTLSTVAFAGDKALAEELFRKAQAVMQKPGATTQDTHQACQWFKESLDQDSTLNTQVALAACYEKEGKNRSAWGLYSDAASQAGPAAAYAKERADTLYKQGFLHIRVELANAPEGTKVILDESSIGMGALNTELTADPGGHVLKVIAPGKKEFEKRFDLTKDSSPLKVPVTLEDAPVDKPLVGGNPPPVVTGEPETTTNPVRILGFVLGGVGLAAGIGALATQLGALSMNNAANNSTAKTMQGAAIGLGVGGGVFLVTGVVLVILGVPKKVEATKAGWHFVPGIGGASVVGTF